MFYLSQIVVLFYQHNDDLQSGQQTHSELHKNISNNIQYKKLNLYIKINIQLQIYLNIGGVIGINKKRINFYIIFSKCSE